MLLPIRSKNPPDRFPFVTCLLIAVNVAVYIGTSNGLEIKRSALEQLAITHDNFSMLRMLTSMFLHANLFHILGNMFFLYLLGFAVEGRLGALRFTGLYLASGFAGALLHNAILGRLHPDLPSLGASGAIMGVMGAAIYVFPFAKVTMLWGFWWRLGLVDWPMWGVGLYYLGFDILFAVLGARDGVGHFAHIGGAIAGFAIAALFRCKRDSADASEAKATLASTHDLQSLSHLELQALHEANPDDTSVVVNWVYRSLRNPGGPRPNCIAEFQRLFPQIVAEQDPKSIAYCLFSLPGGADPIPPRYLLDLAGRLERAGDAMTAIQVYDQILAIPSLPAQDREAATFRIGVLSDGPFGQPGRARACFQQLLAMNPMGSFADQARLRLEALDRRVPRA